MKDKSFAGLQKGMVLDMGQIMEAVFCLLYLLGAAALAVAMLRAGKSNKPRFQFGLLTLVLAGGDAFHLIPRIYGALTGSMPEIHAALGFGTLVTSISMTVFYVMLWEFWRKRLKRERDCASTIAYLLAGIRIILCLFPQNEWLAADASYAWGIYRNIPFALLGLIVTCRFFGDRNKEKHFRLAWLAILLSFAFYLPVVLFADTTPLVGMLMIPKTVCYVWLIVMGYKATKENALNP